MGAKHGSFVIVSDFSMVPNCEQQVSGNECPTFGYKCGNISETDDMHYLVFSKALP